MRDLNKFMNGALAEKLEQAMMEVADNVLDVRTALAPRKPVEQRMLFNRDRMGKAMVAELNSPDRHQMELTVTDEGTTEVQSNTGVSLLEQV